jgi:two-component system phosphate regulon sensor histidine kinase PhoR
MRVDFVANASHELRSPLAALLGFIETLKGPAIDDQDARERFLDIMEREAHRMRRLIDDLLSLSRVEANEHVRPRGQIQIASCVRAALDVLKPRAAHEGMNVVTDVPATLPTVIGDNDQLTQVLHNLVENAIIHGRAGTDITVTAEAIERIPESGRAGVAVHIRDRGLGIAKDMIPRLTERFFRVDPARSRSVPTSSTGLGLAIVKHIIARHRGRLTIDSNLGEGSTFSIYIPSE